MNEPSPSRDPVDVILTLMTTVLVVTILCVSFVLAILWAVGAIPQDPEEALPGTEAHSEVSR